MSHGRSSIDPSLSHGDGRPMKLRARLVMSRIKLSSRSGREKEVVRRRAEMTKRNHALPLSLSLRGPSHRKDGARRSLDGAETRDGAAVCRRRRRRRRHPRQSSSSVSLSPPTWAVVDRGKRDRSGRLRRRRDVETHRIPSEGLLILRMRPRARVSPRYTGCLNSRGRKEGGYYMYVFNSIWPLVKVEQMEHGDNRLYLCFRLDSFNRVEKPATKPPSASRRRIDSRRRKTFPVYYRSLSFRGAPCII